MDINQKKYWRVEDECSQSILVECEDSTSPVIACFPYSEESSKSAAIMLADNKIQDLIK